MEQELISKKETARADWHFVRPAVPLEDGKSSFRKNGLFENRHSPGKRRFSRKKKSWRALRKSKN